MKKKLDLNAALMPYEWEKVAPEYQATRAYADPYIGIDSGAVFLTHNGGRTKLGFRSRDLFAYFEGRDRHILAALALHGQPFGFTWEDVDLLREEYQNEYSGTSLGGELLNLADRIAALLPPRDEADR